MIDPHKQLPISGRIVNQSPYLEVELDVAGTLHQFTTHLVGSYNLQNIILAAGTGYHFGLNGESMAEAIGSYLPENQRSQFVEGVQNRIYLDSYNANPTSMREAINGFLAYATPPTMLILGDMAELGDSSTQEHTELVQWIESLSIDRVLLAGPNFMGVSEQSARHHVFKARQDLEKYLKSTKPSGYHILVKGSRVMELEKILKLVTDK